MIDYQYFMKSAEQLLQTGGISQCCEPRLFMLDGVCNPVPRSAGVTLNIAMLDGVCNPVPRSAGVTLNIAQLRSLCCSLKTLRLQTCVAT
jgi:hypothetical protein